MKSPLPGPQLLTAMAITLVTTVFAGDAGAACFAAPGNPTPSARPVLFPANGQAKALFSAAAQGQSGSSLSASHSVVGMWLTEFLIGNGPNRYDQTFQQFHDDGTELMISNGLPPSLGNVCIGVWKNVAPRSFHLRHMTWNWNPDGTFAGTF